MNSHFTCSFDSLHSKTVCNKYTFLSSELNIVFNLVDQFWNYLQKNNGQNKIMWGVYTVPYAFNFDRNTVSTKLLLSYIFCA